MVWKRISLIDIFSSSLISCKFFSRSFFELDWSNSVNFLHSLLCSGLQRLDIPILGSFPRALDVVNLLDSHVVLLTGGRDPTGRPLLIFPNIGHIREKISKDDYKKVLHYLASITRLERVNWELKTGTNFWYFSPESQELGFVVIIDTRGSSYNVIKPILKTLEEGKIPILKIHHVFLTKPDTFWQKQRTLLAKGKYSFEVGEMSEIINAIPLILVFVVVLIRLRWSVLIHWLK